MTWLYLPSAYLQEPGCLMKDCEPGSNIWASRIAPSSTLSGKLTLPASWSRAWKKEAWLRHLSGPTFSPSTLESFEEKWLALLPDSPVKIFQLLVGVMGSMAPEAVYSSIPSILPKIAV